MYIIKKIINQHLQKCIDQRLKLDIKIKIIDFFKSERRNV